MSAMPKVLCSTCQKASGVVSCHGCRRDFCFGHIAQHRQELNAQLDELANNHDELKQSIAEQDVQPTCHPLMKYVDRWEQESINKIHQAADDARKQLLPIVGTYRPEVTDDLVHLTNELVKARQEEDFVETDLNRWREKLDHLRTYLHATYLIEFNPVDSETALIPKYRINHGSTESFGQIDGNARIEADGKVIQHGPTNEYATVRCQNEYSFGQHRFLLRIEQLGMNHFSCGVVSTSQPMDLILSMAPVHNTNRHANQPWIPPNNRYLNPKIVCLSMTNTYGCLSERTYEVLIDCNQQTIQLIDGRGEIVEMKQMDLTEHPFPWQFFVILCSPADRIRLC